MLGIIGLHVIGQGGLINNSNIHSIKYYVILLLLVFFYTSVDVFGLLSGYLNISKEKNKYSRFVQLIMILIYYCLLIPSIFYLFNIDNIRDSGYKELLFNYFPILIGRYWYITFYLFLFMLIPYINKFCKMLDRKSFKKFLVILFVLLSVIPSLLFRDIFGILSGYSPFWLIYCYMVGAYIKLYNVKIKNNIKYFILLFVSCFLLNSLIRNVEYLWFNNISHGDSFINYISPFTFSMSILLLLFFKEIDIKNSIIRKVIIYYSGTSFSVYIIHCNRVIYDRIMKNMFVPLLNYNSIVVFLGIIISVLFIYFVCSFVDEFRKLLYRLFKVNKLIDLIGKKFDKIFNSE